MILLIDTSSVPGVIATIHSERLVDEMYFQRETPIAMQFPHMVKDTSKLTKIAVATGPGSFTGTRVGVSFGLGLAIGLGVPIVPLSSLAIQAARSDTPVTAVASAGRGRVYYKVPGENTAIGDPVEVPATYPLVGWADVDPLIATGHVFRPETELRSFSQAAAILLKTAQEVPYRNLEIQYMQSFSVSR